MCSSSASLRHCLLTQKLCSEGVHCDNLQKLPTEGTPVPPMISHQHSAQQQTRTQGCEEQRGILPEQAASYILLLTHSNFFLKKENAPPQQSAKSAWLQPEIGDLQS